MSILPIQTPGSLTSLMDGVVALESTISSAITVYRWRPLNVSPPAIYNWLGDASFEQRDLSRWRDTLTIMVRLAIEQSERAEDFIEMEGWMDTLRSAIDWECRSNKPSRIYFDGAATWARRTGMRMVGDTFNSITYMAVEFPIEVQLDRHIHD